MKLKSFLKLVKIQTKVANATPFALGTVFILYGFHSFNIVNFLYMFISLFSSDMATTVISIISIIRRQTGHTGIKL